VVWWVEREGRDVEVEVRSCVVEGDDLEARLGVGRDLEEVVRWWWRFEGEEERRVEELEVRGEDGVLVSE
jgi:hypothetical protein